MEAACCSDATAEGAALACAPLGGVVRDTRDAMNAIAAAWRLQAVMLPQQDAPLVATLGGVVRDTRDDECVVTDSCKRRTAALCTGATARQQSCAIDRMDGKASPYAAGGVLGAS